MKSKSLIGSTFVKYLAAYRGYILQQFPKWYGKECKDLDEVLNERECKHFWITDTVVHTSFTLPKIENSVVFQCLRDMADSKRQWTAQKFLFRIWKSGGRVVVLFVGGVKTNGESFPLWAPPMIHFGVIEINLKTEEITSFFKDASKKDDTYFAFKNLLVFIEMLEVEYIEVQSNRSWGTKKLGQKLVNQEPFPMTIINKNWNIVRVRLTGFQVKGESGAGFLRHQPCGPGGKERRWVFIKPYEKKGYAINANKKRKIAPDGGPISTPGSAHNLLS